MHQTSKRKLAVCAALLTVTAATTGTKLLSNALAQNSGAARPSVTTGAAEAKIYFWENFRNYRIKAPGLIEDAGIRIGNDPIHRQMAEANISLSKAGLVMKEYSPAALPTNLRDYDVLFKFRLQEKEGKLGQFQLRLRHNQNGKPADVIIRIAADEVTVASEGFSPVISGGAKLPSAIIKNAWHTAAVTVRNGQLTVFIDEQRALKPVAQVKTPSLPFTGFNFYAFQDSPFSVTDIIVRDPAPLPDSGIFNILPTPQKTNEAAFKRGVTQSVAANDIFGATIRTGTESDAVKMTVNWNDGASRDVTFSVLPITEQRKVKKDGKDVTEKLERPDAFIRIKGLGDAKSQLDFYVRPLLRRYHSNKSYTDTYHDIVRDWDLLPRASERATCDGRSAL